MNRREGNRFPVFIPRPKPAVSPKVVEVVPQVVPQVVEKVKDPSKLKTLDDIRTKVSHLETKIDLLLLEKGESKKSDDGPKLEFKEIPSDEEDLVSKAKNLAKAKSRGAKIPPDLPKGTEFRVANSDLMSEALRLRYKSKKREKSSK